MANNRTGEFRVGRGITDHVYVDVDGTLLIWPTKAGRVSDGEVEAARAMLRGEPHDTAKLPRVNSTLVAALKEWALRRAAAGAKPVIVIWSMGGLLHARLAAAMCDLSTEYREDAGQGEDDELFVVVCIGKPDLILDDAGHEKLFARHRAIFPHEFKCPEA